MEDLLGDRMKRDYEDKTRYYLPHRTYTIIRIDGRAFHSYTKHCEKPFDKNLMSDMDTTAIELCKNLSGARLAFVQSDEISVLLTDFENINTEAWYKNNLQKIVSVSASIATAEFNKARILRTNVENYHWAHFDSRAFCIPDRHEVINYFIWRHLDAYRNSASMAARSYFSHKELHGKSTKEMRQMLSNISVDIDNLDEGFRHGRIITKNSFLDNMLFFNKKTGAEEFGEIMRRKWCINNAPSTALFRNDLTMLVPIFDQTKDLADQIDTK